jgi:hypothetical protein
MCSPCEPCHLRVAQQRTELRAVRVDVEDMGEHGRRLHGCEGCGAPRPVKIGDVPSGRRRVLPPCSRRAATPYGLKCSPEAFGL